MNRNQQLTIKILFPLLVIMGYSQSASWAQNLEMSWAKQFDDEKGRYGDPGNSIALDSERNVITTGGAQARVDYNPGTNPSDTFYLEPGTYISKLTTHGEFVWARSIAANSGYGVITDSDDNIYVVGTFYGTVDFNPGKGVYNMSTLAGTVWGSGYLLKLNAAGDFLWARKIEGAFNENVTVDHLGNVYVCGTDANAGGFVAKYSPEGEEMLYKSFDGQSTLVEVKDIIVDTAGGIYMTGNFQGLVDFDPDAIGTNIISVIGIHIFIVKLDNAGNLVWVKNIGPNTTSIYITTHTGLGLVVDPTGNLLVTGFFRNTLDFNPGGTPIYLSTVDPAASSAFILKLKNDNGNVIWVTNLDNTWGYDIEVDERSNIYVLCRLMRDSTDMDPGPGVAIARSGGRMDVVINKHDSSGNFLWTRYWGGKKGITDPREFALDPSLGIYTSGVFNDTADFDPGANSFLMHTVWDNGVWASNAFIQKLICVDTNSSKIEVLTCMPSYTLNGIEYQASGHYTQIRPNTIGCDSTIHFVLTIEEINEPLIIVNETILSTSEKYSTYQWMLNNVAIPGAKEDFFQVTENGNYSVVVTGGADNCVDTSDVYVVNNANAVNDYANPEASVTIFPNPVSKNLFVKISSQQIAQNGSLVIYDQLGREMIVQTVKTTDTELVIDVAHLPKGVYVIKYNNIFTQKFTKN